MRHSARIATTLIGALAATSSGCDRDALPNVSPDLAGTAPDFADPCSPRVLCGGACVDVAGNDATNCGGCGVRCVGVPCDHGRCIAVARVHPRFTGVTWPCGSCMGPVLVALADIDGDGQLDVVTANEGSGDVTVLPNLGAGRLGAAVSARGVPLPRALLVASLNARLDALPDVAVAAGSWNGVQLLINRGGRLTPAGVVPTAGSPEALALANVNGDLGSDLIIASADTHQLEIRLGDGSGDFLGMSPVFVPLESGANAVAAADLDGDQRPDFVVVLPALQRAVMVINRGNGAFAAGLPFTAAAGGVRGGLSILDLDLDGVPDIAQWGAATIAYLFRGPGMRGSAPPFPKTRCR